LAAQEGILDKEDVVNENIKLFETKFHSFRRPKQPKQHIQRNTKQDALSQLEFFWIFLKADGSM